MEFDVNEIFKGLGFVIGGVIVTIFPYVKKWIDDKKSGNRFDENIKARNEIKNILDEIRIRCMATRVNIMDYHNGKESILGIPFNYVSMFSESCDRMYKSIIKDIQQQPIEPAVPLLIKLLSSESKYIYTHENDQNESIAVFQKSYGCSSSYTFMMSNNIAGGSLVISYASPPKRMLTTNEILWVKSQIIHINNLRSKIKKHR